MSMPGTSRSGKELVSLVEQVGENGPSAAGQFSDQKSLHKGAHARVYSGVCPSDFSCLISKIRDGSNHFAALGVHERPFCDAVFNWQSASWRGSERADKPSRTFDDVNEGRLVWQEKLPMQEEPLQVQCGENAALLYVSMLCQGSKGPCIFFQNEWLTPNELQYISGRETAKDWKRSIRYKGRSLKTLINRGLIRVHPPICDCRGCRISMPLVSTAQM